MTPIQTHTVVQRRLPLLLLLVPTICQPAIALQQHRRAQVLLRVPPVTRTRSGTTGTKNAFVQAVELLPVGRGLAVLKTVGRGGVTLKVGFDGFVLLIELGEVGDEILDDVGVGEGIDTGFVGCVRGDTAWIEGGEVS